MSSSVKLAKLWMTLSDIKGQLDNVALPLGGHLGLDDPELMVAMEELSERIGEHFQRFRLVAEHIRTKQG